MKFGKKEVVFLIISFLIIVMSFSSFAARQTIITKSNEFRIDLASYNPSPMIPGKNAVLKFEISNLGQKTIDNLEIGFVDNYPFTVATSQFVVIGSLEPGKTRDFEFTVTPQKSTPAGAYKASLQFYSSTIGQFNSESVSLSIQNPSQIISMTNVKTIPETVAPGKSVKVAISLTNTYSSTLRDISLKLDMQNATYFAPKSTTSDLNIQYLAPNEEETIEIELFVSPNAAADVYKIPITLSYTDDTGSSTTKSTYIGIDVNQEPVYSAYLEEITAFEKNHPGKAVLSISNVGPVDIKYLTARILESDSYDIISKSQIYVGNLKPDDYQTAEFKIYRKSKGELKLLITYKDSYGNEYSKVESLALPLFSNSEAIKYGLMPQSTAFTTLLSIIFIILLIWTIWEWYSHKSLKQAINFVFIGIIVWCVEAVRFFKPSNLKKRYQEVKEHIKKKEIQQK